MEKVVAIVQARLSSTRLPRKVLRPLLSKPVLSHVVDRIRKVKRIDQVVIATTVNDDDQELVDWCKENNIDVFRGDLEDVLSRFYHCATQYEAQHIVRITSDNPLSDPKVIEETLEHYFKNKADYCANNLEKTYPHGLDVEVVSYSSLETSFKEAKETFELEHVTQFIRHRPDRFKIENKLSAKDYSNIRITCDEPEDFQLIKILLMALGEEATYEQISSLFDELPALRNMNMGSKERHKVYNDSQGIV
jgi:spore coat polysaccharide biosynthesis protein SpsF